VSPAELKIMMVIGGKNNNILHENSNQEKCTVGSVQTVLGLLVYVCAFVSYENRNNYGSVRLIQKEKQKNHTLKVVLIRQANNNSQLDLIVPGHYQFLAFDCVSKGRLPC
jgi:hypothetical protein